MNLVFLDTETLGLDFDFEKFNQFGVVEKRVNLDSENIPAAIGNFEIALTNKAPIDQNTMDSCENLKLICVLATGTDHIDMDYAKEKGIIVKNCAQYSTHSVAQHTLNLVLALLGQNHEYQKFMHDREWSSQSCFTHFSLRPITELNGKKWGVIGLGNIGKQVLKIAEAFGCSSQYYSTSGKNQNSEYSQVSLNELLKTSDIISIHAPLNEKTKNLISKEELSLIKDDAVLVNLGRGGIINENDFAVSFPNYEFFAGLDVFESEPILADDPLYDLLKTGRLLLTPHIAWASKEARSNLLNLTLTNIKEFLV